MVGTLSIVLITGGNRGIGFETAAQLMENTSNHIIIGSRSAEKGEKAIHDLRKRVPNGSVEMIQLEVASPESIAAAAKKVESEHGKLDVLINNAAVAYFPPGTPLHVSMPACYLTNCIGPAMMVEAFAPLLKKANGTARIINVSSYVGSIAMKMDPTAPYYEGQMVHYRATKSALNMIHACQCYEYRNDDIKSFVICPGFTQSNLSPHNTAENNAIPTSEGAKPIVDAASGKRDAEHGGFLQVDGQWPW